MGCEEILKNGIFNKAFISQSVFRQQLFERYIYKQDFSTHDEAIGAGISVGVPIYGVPVEIGGTFSREQKDTWRSSHQQFESDQSTVVELYKLLKEEASPVIVNAWLMCKEGENSAEAYGLRMAVITKSDKLLEAEISWRELPGTSNSMLPEVLDSIIIGGLNANTGSNKLKVAGSKVLDGYKSDKIGIVRNDPYTDIYVSLSTSRGTVTGFANKKPRKPEIQFYFVPETAEFGDTVDLYWKVAFADEVEITGVDSKNVSGNIKMKAEPEGTKEIKLIAKNEDGGINEAIASLRVKERPYVTGIEFYGETGGDDKDANTNFTLRVDGVDGQQIAFGNNNTDRYPERAPFKLTLGITRRVTHDIILHSTAVLGFAPDGDDTWNFSANMRIMWNSKPPQEIPMGSHELSDEHRDESIGFYVPKP